MAHSNPCFSCPILIIIGCALARPQSSVQICYFSLDTHKCDKNLRFCHSKKCTAYTTNLLLCFRCLGHVMFSGIIVKNYCLRRVSLCLSHRSLCSISATAIVFGVFVRFHFSVHFLWVWAQYCSQSRGQTISSAVIRPRDYDQHCPIASIRDL